MDINSMDMQSKLALISAVADMPSIPKSYKLMAGHFLLAVLAKEDGGGKWLLGIWSGSIIGTLGYALYKRIFGDPLDRPTPTSSIMSRRTKGPAADHVPVVDRYEVKGMVRQLRMILKLAFPSLVSKQSFHLFAYTVLLCLRIILTIKIAKVTGALGKMVGARTWTSMFQKQVVFGLWCLPAAAVNSLLSYESHKLALSLRQELTRTIHIQYMRNLVFYRSNNIGRHRIDDIDTRVTQDVKKFCTQLVELYGNLLKPSLEVVMLSRTLSGMMGGRNLVGFFAFFVIAAQWLRVVMPPFARYHKEAQQLEGSFRSHHTRLITHAEEIAFYGGAEREREIVDESFSIIRVLNKKQYFLQLLMGMLDGYVVKYGASMVAYSMLMPAVYMGLNGLDSKAAPEVMEYYLTSTQLFVSLGNACKHLVLSYKSIQSLSGLSSRVSSLVNMLSRRGARGNDEEEEEMKLTAVRMPESTKVAPQVLEGSEISFENVDLFSPGGELLVKGLTFSVSKNTNVLVSGPNGSGKSSLFRVLGGLWPLCTGKMVCPPKKRLFYVPQKPYLVPGSLRDQITYPEHITNESKDKQLDELMALVDLSYIVDRESWGAIKDWADELSGGEKQRVAMARLFYHRPEFGILDECTSAVSMDVEGKIYENCKRLGITIFTVSHRPQLMHHHDYMLRFDGEGNWEWCALQGNSNETLLRVTPIATTPAAVAAPAAAATTSTTTTTTTTASTTPIEEQE